MNKITTYQIIIVDGKDQKHKQIQDRRKNRQGRIC